ncbi:hypothetical protein ACIQBJ_16475 [Kitasatospora sp. NPDC088391]|uniref:hypothetical protein n=1 Tax=Kitasatospora sp. NPDC088391 TaxID=3364074 RepID=UPI003816C1E6
MESWGTLAAAVVGAAIALVGQYLAKRREERAKAVELLLNSCAEVAASCSDLLYRVWEERELGLPGRVEGWDLNGHRLATARIRILSGDPALVAASEEVNTAGQALSSYWRKGVVDDTEFQVRRERYRAATDSFVDVSGRRIGVRAGSAASRAEGSEGRQDRGRRASPGTSPAGRGGDGAASGCRGHRDVPPPGVVPASPVGGGGR